MKKILIIVILFVNAIVLGQNVSCSDLLSYAKKQDSYPQSAYCYGSSMLSGVKRYDTGNGSLVVAYIKSNEYDYKGKPYVFCGISSSTWINFTSEGSYDSWGKAFHKYIMNNKCNCY